MGVIVGAAVVYGCSSQSWHVPGGAVGVGDGTGVVVQEIVGVAIGRNVP